MSGSRFDRWLETVVASAAVVYAKRLSANDTVATGAHQAGPYLRNDFSFRVAPEIHREEQLNPDIRFPLQIVSHDIQREVRLVWYNNLLHGGTRNETRLTNLGGVQSPLLDSESTGALVLFAFTRTADGPFCQVWICGSLLEESKAEAYLGVVEPGVTAIWDSGTGAVRSRLRKEAPKACRLAPDQIPREWLKDFPSGAEVVKKTLEIQPARRWRPDERLLRRRNCEYEVFLSIEEVMTLPVIQRGFATVDEFVERAQTVLQRRRARSGRSLELQVKEILMEEGLVEGRDFEHDVESDPGRRPDFLFPSQKAYRDGDFPTEQLTMLATKTTCRDRWRQVRNEADRIGVKHLLTLQEGVTAQQYGEMVQSGVRLVVPRPIHQRYPATVRAQLLTVADFLTAVRERRVRSA